MDFQEYMQMILPRCSNYLRDHRAEDAEYVIDKIDRTELECKRGDTPAQNGMGLLGIQHLIGALYYTQNHYDPEKAAFHARTARENFDGYLEHVSLLLSDEEQRTTRLYRDTAADIEAYCALQEDEFERCLQMLSDRELTAIVMALAGTASTRLAYEVPGKQGYAYVAYNLLTRMDDAIRGPMQWLYEEDLFRTAYSFLTLLVTDAGNSFPQETRIPQSREQALAYAKKIYALLSDPEQKAWAMEDIQAYQD